MCHFNASMSALPWQPIRMSTRVQCGAFEAAVKKCRHYAEICVAFAIPAELAPALRLAGPRSRWR
jgi:hypothetical protein